MARADITWLPEASKRLKKIPFFVRPIAKAKLERAALSRGISVITLELIDEIKKQEMG
jgi:hypothetical protein